MTKKAAPPWWQIPTLIGAGIAGLTALGTVAVNYASFAALPERTTKVEEHNEVQDEELDDLKGWAKQIQGYTQAMQQQQMMPNQAAPVPEPWEFIKEEGEWQIFKDPDGILQCCDGTQCVPKPKKGKCR